MLKNIFTNNRGVTLVELLAVISIMVFIIASILIIQNQFYDVYDEVQSGSVQNEEASFFVEFFSNQVRKSNAQTVVNNNISLTFYSGSSVQFIYNSDSDKITFMNEDGILVDLLENVISYSVTKPGDSNGIFLSFDIVNDGKTNTFSTKVYSNTGLLGN